MNPDKSRAWTPKIVGGTEASSEAPAAVPAKKEVPLTAPPSMLFKDAKYAFGHLDLMEQALGRVDEIGNFIASLKGYTSTNETMRMRDESVRLTPLEGLIKHLLQSTEAEWKEHPTFYIAVMSEYHARIKWIDETARS